VVTVVEFEEWELERITRTLGVITTIGKDGAPHATPVIVNVEDGVLRLETNSDSQKLRNIERNPRVAILVFGQPKWGVLINGEAEILSKGVGKEQSQLRVVPKHKASWRRKEG
jgi:PPOX class probable F420-dependent enzyme